MTAPDTTSPERTRDGRLLNSTQLQRVKDAKRLAETKLQGIEERLGRLHAQQTWLRRYTETSTALAREKKHLFELGKQKAAMAKEASMLERYDLFEGIHGIYQKVSVLAEQIGRDKRGLSLLEHEAENTRRKKNDQEKVTQQAFEQLKSATANQRNAFDNICSSLHLDGLTEAFATETSFLLALNNKIKEEVVALSSMIAEEERNVEAQQAALEQLRSRRRSLEMHENMLQHGETVLLQLGIMQEINARRDELQRKLQQNIRRQNDENELLGKAFAQFQDIVSQTESADAELNMHRSYIQGQDGLRLQERALMLKGRRQMLLSALSLWKRISSGYESIEEKGRQVSQLRMDVQHMENAVRELETQVGKAQRLCREKEYTYLLSKGQDVIQLRADLHEGTACSVCGATHHPYHSDTMLDQSKLIGQMKSDYEQLNTELGTARRQLTDMQTELAAAKGELRAREDALAAIHIRQNEDVQEWKLYATLDRTLTDCSESTNLEARTTLLRQFIENVTRDSETAEKELETFTFHQSSIARISAELQKLEQRKAEINVRLSELNTACHILGREVEQTGTQLEAAGKQFTHFYENMQSAVSIKDWFPLWQRNPEKLYEQIQKLLNEWTDGGKEIARRQADFDTAQAKLDGMKALLHWHERSSAAIATRTEELQERIAEADKARQQTIPQQDARNLHAKLQENTELAATQYEQQRNLADEVRHEADIMQGRHDYYIAHIDRLENEKKQLCEQLDLWMHGFNLQHPPVQQSELAEVFADGKDWSKIRQCLKQVNTDTLICQTKVEDLNSRLIALETEDGRCNTAQPDIQEHIAAKQQELTEERNETLMQIARLSLRLEDHEKALAFASDLTKNI